MLSHSLIDVFFSSLRLPHRTTTSNSKVGKIRIETTTYFRRVLGVQKTFHLKEGKVYCMPKKPSLKCMIFQDFEYSEPCLLMIIYIKKTKNKIHLLLFHVLIQTELKIIFVQPKYFSLNLKLGERLKKTTKNNSLNCVAGLFCGLHH